MRVRRISKLLVGLVAVTAVLVVLIGAGTADRPPRAGAQSLGSIAVQPTPDPAFDGDAPDPDVVLSGSTYYAFTTGTTLGNYLQVLVDTSGSPLSGWSSYNGLSYGSSAMPVVPAWEQLDTQTSPGVFFWGGRWLMYYDASQAGHAAGTGWNCLSVAVAASLTPTDPVFTDSSTQPLECQANLGGSIDPSPFIDPATGAVYLVWKSNDGGSTQSAHLWSQQLSADGLSLVGTPHLLVTQDMVNFPFESTIENPDMVYSDGTYFLLFSAGIWDSASYSETYAICAGPQGPCSQPESSPILTSYGSTIGPGGGSLFQDASGNWMLAYAAWSPGCTDYSCGVRRLFVGPATLTNPGLAWPVTGMAAAPGGAGYWLVDAQGAVSIHGSVSFYGSMAGQHLNAPIDHIVATPDGGGYWLVAADGGIFTFGDAHFYGSMGGQHLNAPVVDIAPTSDGGGYWLVASDGGVFSFGDAVFRGSMGGNHLNRPVVGISPDNATGGYWLVASDGGVFSYGAPFFGSTGALTLNQPVKGMSATSDGGGYWFVAADGGVFAFGDAAFQGSMGGTALNSPMQGMAADPAGGYWLVASDGGVFSFGAPFFGAD